MSFDYGFDIYAALDPNPLNQERHDLFLSEVLANYAESKEVEKRRSYIEFLVGEHPLIPYTCKHFLRFSFKVSGSSEAKPYIRGVYNITKKWLGNRVQFWHELYETGDQRQLGFYNWKEVYAVKRKMKEQDTEVAV